MPPRSRSSGSRSALVRWVLAAWVLAACTPDGRPGPEETAGQPGPVDAVRLAYPEWPPTLNPVTEPAPGARDVLRAVLPSFYLVTPDLEYRLSLLAEEPRVEVDADRMEVAFRIREATWSDGTPITVEDVAFTARVMSDPAVEAVDAVGFDHLQEVAADGPREGRLVLSPPLAGWRDLFSAGRFVLPAHAASSPGAVARWDDGPPVAGGPFRLGKIVPGRSLILDRNPRFFGPPPLAERIEVLFVPDPTTALQMLRAGVVDVVSPMLGVQWGRRLGDVPGAEAEGRYGSHLVALVPNATRLGAGERRDVAEAMDRERFVEVVLRDEGRVADALVPPELDASVPAWSRYGEGSSPQAEFPGELGLVYVRTELLELTARFLQVEARAAGIDLELVGLESDVFWERFLPERRFDLALVELRDDPAPDLAEWVGEPGTSLTGLRDTNAEGLVTRAAAGDQAALRDAQERLARLAAVLPLYQPRTAMGWRSGIGGVDPNPSTDGPLWNAWAWGEAGV